MLELLAVILFAIPGGMWYAERRLRRRREKAQALEDEWLRRNKKE